MRTKPISTSEAVEELNNNVEKAAGHGNEGVGVAVCEGKRKRRTATKKVE
jgi:hypothetical protein